jgi:Ran GTPase-activating protein (RanGAP) involved in mRNA processing and transport
MSLIESLKRSPYLRTYCSNRNDIRNLKYMRYLTESVTGGLQYISLISSNIGDEGGAFIGEGLSKSRMLKTLILSNNSLSDETAKSISEALKKPIVRLQNLDLSSNLINDAGGNLLGECLIIN